MNDHLERIKKQIKSGDALYKLLMVNILVYLLFVIINVGSKLILGAEGGGILTEYLYPFTALSSDFSTLLFKPWTLLTHLFVHDLGPWHLIGNMMYLYFLGRLFLEYFSQKQLVSLYFLAGLAGALMLLIVANLSPLFQNDTIAYGASAAVLGIVAAISFYAPTKEIFLFGIFKVQLQYIGIVLILTDLIFFDDGNAGGRVAHLGGAAAGLYFALQQKKGKDISAPLARLIDRVVTLFSPGPKTRMSVSHSRVRKMTDEEYNLVRKASQEQIDEILDKISKSGYESLSKKEKELLFQYSKK